MEKKPAQSPRAEQPSHSSTYAFFQSEIDCTAKGRMEGVAVIASQPDAFYLDAAPELRETLGPRLEKYLIADDAQFEDISDEWTLHHVFGSMAPSAPKGGFVSSYKRFGLPGHDVWIQGPQAAIVGDAVDFDVIETLRIEHAIPRWGAELTDHTLPPEAGPHMLAAISYTKGCYVGQETIARLKSVGHVNRELVLMQAASAEFPAPGTKISQGDRDVGTVTSAIFSPRLGTGIALGFVARQSTAIGTELRTGGIDLHVIEPLNSKSANK